MKSPSDWAPDGRSLLYAEGGDIELLAQDADGWTSRPLLATPASEECASVSPDGRWVAYASGDWVGMDTFYGRQTSLLKAIDSDGFEASCNCHMAPGGSPG